MSETREPTVAEKRAWLKENGYPVGDRGTLSAASEEAYANQVPASEKQGEQDVLA